MEAPSFIILVGWLGRIFLILKYLFSSADADLLACTINAESLYLMFDGTLTLSRESMQLYFYNINFNEDEPLGNFCEKRDFYNTG